MTLTDEQRKRLTEYLGECWHTFRSSNYLSFPDRCLDCDAYITSLSRRNYTTDPDMMALFRKMVDEDDFRSFRAYAVEVDVSLEYTGWLFYNAERFCNLVAEWLEVK